MTDILTMLKERLAEAESDAERLRAAITAVEGGAASPPQPRPAGGRVAAKAPAAKAPAAKAPAAKAPAAKAPAAKAQATSPQAAKRQAAKPPAKVVPLGALMKWVADHPGTTTTGIAKGTQADQAQVLALLKEAEGEGNARREGERRATRWWVVTDADRIAKRAAELEAQRKGASAR